MNLENELKSLTPAALTKLKGLLAKGGVLLTDLGTLEQHVLTYLKANIYELLVAAVVGGIVVGLCVHFM